MNSPVNRLDYLATQKYIMNATLSNTEIPLPCQLKELKKSYAEASMLSDKSA